MDVEAIWNILEGLTATDVYNAYREVMRNFKVIYVGTSLGVAASLFLLIREYGDVIYEAIGFSEGRRIQPPNWAKLTGIIRPTIWVVVIVLAYPQVLKGIEYILAGFQDSLGGQIGPESNFRDLWREEALRYQKLMAQTSTWDIGQKMSLIINYYIILLIKPFIILLEQDAYSLFLALRYLYLIILELFGGVALALYINKETRTHTYTWLKHMLFNYAMLGAFAMANELANLIIDFYINRNSVYSYNILIIAFGAVLKLFLFKQSFNILKSNIF